MQKNFVPAIYQRPPAVMPVNAEVIHTIDAAPLATQHVEMRTSAVDRAQGFLLASVPLYAGFATLVLLVCIFFYSVPFLSLPALVVFWLAFIAAWVVGYTHTLSVSAEGVSMYEAKQKWQIIAREHDKRWEHYERLIEETD